MADTMEDAAFWLPSHFLTDDDYLLESETLPCDPLGTGFRPGSRHLPLYGSSSVLDSPVSSTETEPDRDEFLAELNRQLARSSLLDGTHQLFPTSQTLSRDTPAKPWLLATSPQSTLPGFGSWANRSGNVTPSGPSRVASPPPTPPSDSWELILAAAGQVARMKMMAAQAQISHQNQGLLGPPRNPPSSAFAVPKNPNTDISSLYSLPAPVSYNYSPANQFQQVGHEMKQQLVGHCQLQRQQMLRRARCGGGCCGGCGGGGGSGGASAGSGGALGLPPSAWPPLRAVQQQQVQQSNHPHPHPTPQHQQGGGSAMRALFSGAGIKRHSAGTGVFLPRRYGTSPAEPRKKPGCPTVLLPARVVQALNLNIEETNAYPQLQQTMLSDH
ncbi:hypothetical protein Dimus_036238, partial [Dionaea muscipula]